MSRPFPSRSFNSREPKYRRNGKIRAREVRVLGEDKEQLGVMTLTEALRLAQSKGLDLVEIAPAATPPVCRIVNFGKLAYEESKSHKETRNPGNKLKELQLSAGIDPHDFSTKLNRAIEFLCEEMKVRIKLRFRGRQRAHKEVGFDIINRFIQQAAPYGQADSPAKMLGERDINVIISPLPRNKRAKNPRAEDAPAPGSAAGEPGSSKSSSQKPPSQKQAPVLAPAAITEAVPDALPLIAPLVVSEVVPDVIPLVVPLVVSEVVPDVIPLVVPEVVPIAAQ